MAGAPSDWAFGALLIVPCRQALNSGTVLGLDIGSFRANGCVACTSGTLSASGVFPRVARIRCSQKTRCLGLIRAGARTILFFSKTELQIGCETA